MCIDLPVDRREFIVVVKSIGCEISARHSSTAAYCVIRPVIYLFGSLLKSISCWIEHFAELLALPHWKHTFRNTPTATCSVHTVELNSSNTHLLWLADGVTSCKFKDTVNPNPVATCVFSTSTCSMGGQLGWKHENMCQLPHCKYKSITTINGYARLHTLWEEGYCLKQWQEYQTVCVCAGLGNLGCWHSCACRLTCTTRPNTVVD